MTDNNKDIFALIPHADYEDLIERIDLLWSSAKRYAVEAVNTQLLDANWHTGQYIVEFEQHGKIRAEYGKQLLVRLSRDLTSRCGKGFSRSNLIYMRKFYLCFPKSETVSHLLTWSHYFELLKCEDELERQFYFQEAISQKWKVRELKGGVTGTTGQSTQSDTMTARHRRRHKGPVCAIGSSTRGAVNSCQDTFSIQCRE